MFLVARKGEGYGGRGGYGGNLLPWRGTYGSNGTNDDGLGLMRQTRRIALLGMSMRMRMRMGMRRRRQWHQRWLMMWRRRRHDIVIRNATTSSIIRLRRRNTRNWSSGIGSLCTWYVLLRLAGHGSRYAWSVMAIGCGILRWGRRVPARRRRTGEAVHCYRIITPICISCCATTSDELCCLLRRLPFLSLIDCHLFLSNKSSQTLIKAQEKRKKHVTHHSTCCRWCVVAHEVCSRLPT